MQFRCSKDQRRRWEAAAGRAGETVREWASDKLDRASIGPGYDYGRIVGIEPNTQNFPRGFDVKSKKGGKGNG